MESARPDEIRVGDVIFDPTAGLLTGAAGSARLEPRAADVLAELARAEGALLTRETLLDRCWGDGGSDEALTQAIAQVRRVLTSLGQPDAIATHPKRGYRLQCLSERAPAALATPRRRPPLRRLAAALIVLLLLVWLSQAHGPRHFIRHNLGLHPGAQP